MCLHEEDFGILWKQYRPVHRRGRCAARPPSGRRRSRPWQLRVRLVLVSPPGTALIHFGRDEGDWDSQHRWHPRRRSAALRTVSLARRPGALSSAYLQHAADMAVDASANRVGRGRYGGAADGSDNPHGQCLHRCARRCWRANRARSAMSISAPPATGKIESADERNALGQPTPIG